MTSTKETPLRLRFKRAIKFPLFNMAAGEIWKCYREWGTGRDYVQALATGSDRFPFAGGQCLVQDIEEAQP